MDWYEKELLARAVEAAQDNELSVWRDEDGWNVDSPTCLVKSGPTLADALTALLADLGEPVPERPSAERVAEVWAQLHRAFGVVAGEVISDLGDMVRDQDDGAAVLGALIEKKREA